MAVSSRAVSSYLNVFQRQIEAYDKLNSPLMRIEEAPHQADIARGGASRVMISEGEQISRRCIYSTFTHEVINDVKAVASAKYCGSAGRSQ